jgi:hypothetical protein
VRRETDLSEVLSQVGVTLPALPTFPSSTATARAPGRPPVHVPRSHIGGGHLAIARSIPVFVKIEYHLGTKSAEGLVTIKKHYELTVAAPAGEISPLTVTGDGTLLYDSHSQLVRSLQFKGALVCEGKESTLEVPFTYMYKQMGNAASQMLAANASPPKKSNSSTSAVRAEPPAQGTASAEPAAAETPDAAKPAERAALPDQESRDKAAALVEQVFGGELKKARTCEEKLGMVEKLLGLAAGEKSPAQQFALLNRARLVAISSGDLAATRKVVDEMTTLFRINAQKANLAVLQAIAEKAAGPQNAPVAEFAMTMLDEAIADNRFDLANHLHTIALRAAHKCNDAEILKRLQQQAKQIRRCSKGYEAVQDSIKALEKDPRNPDANLALGKYYCLSKREWEKGLPMLARGSDPDLRSAAEKDRAHPESADDRLAMADRWWELAEKLAGDEQESMRIRALTWYQESLTNLTGLDHARVEKRLEQYASLLGLDTKTEKPMAPPRPAVEVQPARPSNGRVARPSRFVQPRPQRPAPVTGVTVPEIGILGGRTTDSQFSDVAPPGGALVGLEIGLGKWGHTRDIIVAIRPIFRTRSGGEVLGQQHGTDTSRLLRVKAKSGYAIGAITVRSTLVVDGLSVTFMRYNGHVLVPGNSYESEWIATSGGRTTRLGGDGTLVTGICGRENDKDCTGLGLVLKR